MDLTETEQFFRLNEIFNEIVLIKRNFTDNYTLYKQILNNSREFQLVKLQWFLFIFIILLYKYLMSGGYDFDEKEVDPS